MSTNPCSECNQVTEVLLRKREDGTVWQPCRRCYDHYLTAQGIDGCEMPVVRINEQWDIRLPDFRAARSEWDWWERARMEFIYTFVKHWQNDAVHGFRPRRRPILFDIGAEEGDFTGLYSIWGADVVAFEPNKPVWPNIKAIWEANDLPPIKAWFTGFAGDHTNEFAREHGVLGTEGWPLCARGLTDGEHGFASYVESNDTKATMRIDDFCNEQDILPDLITIDVEGAELKVLSGAEGVLRGKRPVVVVSVHDEIMRYDYGINPADVHRFMEACDYRAFLIKADGHECHFGYVPSEDWQDP